MIGAEKYGTPQKALTVWKDYMVDMGFGYTLGVDLPGEARGMIPIRNIMTDITTVRGTDLHNKQLHWSGEVTLTPLQIANLGATIANRGYYITPHVVRGIEGQELIHSTRYVIV